MNATRTSRTHASAPLTTTTTTTTSCEDDTAAASVAAAAVVVRARIYARNTYRHTAYLSRLVVVAAAAAVVAAAADVADAGARARNWRGEWERGKWSLAESVRVDVRGKSR
jgi:hypothetical protein